MNQFRDPTPPAARMQEVKPDLVNLSDVADLIGCSRQNVRKYAAGEVLAVKARFPAPAITGSMDLWHLCEVVSWFVRNTEFKPSREIVETSMVASMFNVEAQPDRVLRSRDDVGELLRRVQ